MEVVKLVALEHNDAFFLLVGHHANFALLVTRHLLREALAVQVLFQLVVAIPEQCVVVGVLEKVVGQDHQQEQKQHVKLQVLVGAHQHHHHQQVLHRRAAAQVVEHQQQHPQDVRDLVEQELQPVHHLRRH